MAGDTIELWIAEMETPGINVLPDSRTKGQAKGVVLGYHPTQKLNWVPGFCPNCGILTGYTPEDNCSFACFPCNDCAERVPEFGTWVDPDEVFWAKVARHQIEKYGHLLPPETIRQLLEANDREFSLLVKDGPYAKLGGT